MWQFPFNPEAFSRSENRQPSSAPLIRSFPFFFARQLGHLQWSPCPSAGARRPGLPRAETGAGVGAARAGEGLSEGALRGGAGDLTQDELLGPLLGVALGVFVCPWGFLSWLPDI